MATGTGGSTTRSTRRHPGSDGRDRAAVWRAGRGGAAARGGEEASGRARPGRDARRRALEAQPDSAGVKCVCIRCALWPMRYIDRIYV
eukprot:scaffold11797_cov64-Phaeocystis_antarctica.AAC.2